MKKETPLEFYERTAAEKGIKLEDLLPQPILTSIKQFPNEETLGRTHLSFYELPQINYYSSPNNGRILIASTRLILNKRKISRTNSFIKLKELIEEESLFGIMSERPTEINGFGYGNVIIRKGSIFSSEPHFKGCNEDLFKPGKDYREAIGNLLEVYASNSRQT